MTLPGFATMRRPPPSWYGGVPLDDDEPFLFQRPAIVGDGVGAGVRAGVERLGARSTKAAKEVLAAARGKQW